MKVGILGSGDVGKALAKGFLQEGHNIVVATRDTNSEKAAELKKELNVEIGNFETVAKFAELAVLCTKWNGTENAIKLAGPGNLAGKTVIDTTNPLDFSSGFPPQLALGRTDSAGEQVQRWLPGSHIVKAFNIAGNQYMYKPDFPGGPPTMFICGNDESAKKTVEKILDSFGWEALDIGDITGARELEPMCILWVKYGAKAGAWAHAFKLLRK